jgi:hypothetical protein
MANGAQGETAPSGSLDAVVIHDGKATKVHPAVRFLGWLKGLFSA